jgi:hypothetical protein
VVVRIDEAGDDGTPCARDDSRECAGLPAGLEIAAGAQLGDASAREHEAVMIQHADRTAGRRRGGQVAGGRVGRDDGGVMQEYLGHNDLALDRGRSSAMTRRCATAAL